MRKGVTSREIEKHSLQRIQARDVLKSTQSRVTQNQAVIHPRYELLKNLLVVFRA